MVRIVGMCSNVAYVCLWVCAVGARRRALRAPVTVLCRHSLVSAAGDCGCGLMALVGVGRGRGQQAMQLWMQAAVAGVPRVPLARACARCAAAASTYPYKRMHSY